MVKLGFTGVYIIFLISVLTSTHNLCFVQKYEKYQNFLSENFHFLMVKFSVYLNRHVFVMDTLSHVEAHLFLLRFLVLFSLYLLGKLILLLLLLSCTLSR